MGSFILPCVPWIYGSLLMFAKALELCNWVWCFLGSLGVICWCASCFDVRVRFSNYDLNLLPVERVIWFYFY